MKEYDIQKLVGGIVFIIILVKCFKKIIREPRPYMPRGSTFGMPSTRAATLFFIVVFLILVNKLSNQTIVYLLLAALFACSLKYFMQEHSFSQLFFGALIGIGLAYIFTLF